jgi:hypothetical protein
MDSFAAVLTTFGCSSMYEVICVKKQTFRLMSNDHNHCEYMCDCHYFFSQVKNKPYVQPVLADVFVLEVDTVANT